MQTTRAFASRPKAFNRFAENVDDTCFAVNLGATISRQKNSSCAEAVEGCLDDWRRLTVTSRKRRTTEGVSALGDPVVIGLYRRTNCFAGSPMALANSSIVLAV